MPDYRRLRIPGGCYFFTVSLLDRNTALLVDRIELLRESVRATKQRKPFHIDAWVVLPEHMHCIWTLPPSDDDFSGRWREIKRRFPKLCRKQEPDPEHGFTEMNEASGSDAFGSTLFVMSGITRRIWIIFISTL